jgi:hypothetical protein
MCRRRLGRWQPNDKPYALSNARPEQLSVPVC